MFAELEPRLITVECRKGEHLLNQGDHEMEQYFVLEGILKRVVTNESAKEMILRVAAEGDIETSYAAWRLKTPAPTVSSRLRRRGLRSYRCRSGWHLLRATPTRSAILNMKSCAS